MTATLNRPDPGGFSVIELMVVVVIISLLAAIAIPNYFTLLNRAKEGSVVNNAHVVEVIVQDYSIVNDAQYPDLADLTPDRFPGGAYPANPFTGVPFTLGPLAYSQGDIGYELAGGGYTIEGYGYDLNAGPNDNGTVVILP